MRYLILDLDKMDTTDAKSDSAIFRLELKGIALSEEESLAKFKEVFDMGCIDGQGNYPFEETSWEEFKKTL